MTECVLMDNVYCIYQPLKDYIIKYYGKDILQANIGKISY